MSPVRRRRWLPGLLVLVFVVMPIVEIYVIIQVGQVIGALWTVLLLVADSVLGAWLIKREGARAWRGLSDELQAGRMPTRELADGGLILIGGSLMLAPGFVTDALGILLVLPVTRPVFRGLLATWLGRRLVVSVQRPGAGPSTGPVVRGEVVDEDE